MDKRLKISFYLLLFGIVAVYVAFSHTPKQLNYSPSQVLGENTNLTLFVEPDDGKTPLLNYINSSNQILTEVYMLSDPDIITAIASKSAKIILEEHPFGGSNLNQKTKAVFGNTVSWSSSSFTLTHEKSIVFDDRIVCILNMNLTKTAFVKNREYNICSEEKNDVTEVTNIFNADWSRNNYEPTDEHLIVSPNNSRGKLTALINSAQKSIDIEIEVIADQQIIDLLKTKTVPIRLIIPEQKSVDNPVIDGVQTKHLKSPYPHAKLIIVDNARAYIGSVNLSTQSLDQNRELGILVSQPNILERLNTTFAKDWNSANL